eukprot:scaffold246792_cov33-Tisochrysis_lutea.AAC.1
MRLSDEALHDVLELVQLDAKVVLDAARREPAEAVGLALDSARHRGPLLLWAMGYQLEKLQLCFYSCIANHTSMLAPLAPELSHQAERMRSAVEARLERHARGLRVALLALRPTIRQRVLQAAREQPQDILPLLSNLLRSGIYRIRWKANRISRDYGLQGEDNFQRKKNVLVEKLVKQALWLHRRIEPYTGPTTTAADVREPQSPP